MRLTLIILTVTVVTGQYTNNRRINSGGFARPPSPSLRENVSDGQYRTNKFTRNDANDGRYVPDNSGKYVHIDQAYDGGYGDRGASGGQYTGKDDKYKHQNGLQGKIGKYTGDKVTSASNNKPQTNKIVTIAKPTQFPKKFEPQTTKAPPRVRVQTYGNEGGWKIIQDHKNVDPPYHYLYETENKILAEETGRMHNNGKDEESMKAFGFYEYIGDDGQKYRVDYTADENGFIPKGAHIPTPPPVPESVQKTLDFLQKSGKL